MPWLRGVMLGLVLAVLMPAVVLAEGARVEVLAKTTTSWDGATLPPYREGQPEVTVLRITVPPGVSLPMHAHPVINAGILLSGQLTVETAHGRTLQLAAGEVIVEVIEEWHYGRNDGDTEAVIVVFYAGLEQQPITVLHETEHAEGH
jgi:quercetin dioxygenase-like cupin family protein